MHKESDIVGAETTEPKEVRGMEKLILPNIIENNDEIMSDSLFILVW